MPVLTSDGSMAISLALTGGVLNFILRAGAVWENGILHIFRRPQPENPNPEEANMR